MFAGKENMKYIPLLIFGILFSCGSSQKITYKDKNYYGETDRIKTLFVYPITSITCSAPSGNGSHDSSNKSAAITDSLKKYLNSEYNNLSNKYYNEKKISIVNKPMAEAPRNDSLKCFSTLILNKKGTQSINFYVPDKSYLESLNINCNYLFRFSELRAAIASSPAGGMVKAKYPPFQLSGKYILWDYDNSRAICAGEFDYNFNLSSVDNANLLEKLHKFIRIYLDRTPFWSIQFQEEKRENLDYYYKPH